MDKRDIIRALLLDLAVSPVEETLKKLEELPMARELLEQACQQFGVTKTEYITRLKEILGDVNDFKEILETVVQREENDIGELAESVWNRGIEFDEHDPSTFRLDSCGALITRSAYNDPEHPLGWKECMILPESKGGDNRIENLRPMHFKNIEAKSDDYPTYKSAITLLNNQNVESIKEITVNTFKQEELKKIYDL